MGDENFVFTGEHSAVSEAKIKYRGPINLRLKPALPLLMNQYLASDIKYSENTENMMKCTSCTYPNQIHSLFGSIVISKSVVAQCETCITITLTPIFHPNLAGNALHIFARGYSVMMGKGVRCFHCRTLNPH